MAHKELVGRRFEAAAIPIALQLREIVRAGRRGSFGR
jgi:hypothetical protein